MKRTASIILLLLSMLLAVPVASAQVKSTKEERNLILEGNKLFNEGKFNEAETMYRKALQVNPASETARFNIGSALIRQAGNADTDETKKIMAEASSIMKDLASNATQKQLMERANYNLGNISFNGGNYKEAIDFYKQALRLNPANDNARDNLRLAQKKLQEQQQNKDNQNQDNKDKDKDKNKDQNQDKDKQDQNKDENKDNKDQDKQDKQDQQQQQPPQPKGGISDQNAEKILKAMENEENATRQRINQKQQKGNPARPVHGNPW